MAAMAPGMFSQETIGWPVTYSFIGILAGPPISGALLSLRSSKSLSAVGGGAGDFRYLWAQFFVGAMLVAGAVFSFTTRIACSRSLRVKV